MFVTTNCLLQQFLYLLVDVLGGEAEFLVEDLVRSGKAEGVKTPNGAILAYKTFKRTTQTSCHTETLDTFRQHFVLISLVLLAEESFGRYADNLQTDTFCAEEFCPGE